MKVAVLGTGIMGTGVVRTLLREGHDVTTWNRTREKAQPLADDGATVVDTVREAVAGAEVVVTVLFDGDAVVDVLREATDQPDTDQPDTDQPATDQPDTDQPATDAQTGAAAPVWLQASTIGAADTGRVVDLAAERGVPLVEAMMLGTKKPAETGALVMLAAGDPDLLARVQPVLDAMGAKTITAGPSVGQGTALKLAANAWIASITAATAQSLALTQSFGLDPQLFLDAIDGGQSDTPYAHLKGATMIAGEYPAQFALDGLRKDIALMRAAAEGTSFDPSLLEALAGLYATAADRGHGGDDVAAVRAAFTD
ncbi:3-hydroxyisobutyrate dehydrogenase [Frigoribacterium sp. PhB160]|uniref:NAD(P)-dependent oxidoreductase n=1 Tax=Frigoribacterium sp. PhB160 TaxID=2485192 RepID=UPI000F464193|nr:NAD(P)-dependent oxidoreductase [Frigoribacterium sp. PhB160]ROS61023.1 3-hydroxyisobutyrate dehydrogenase [Frigoribacterium sp. PhB160]